MKRYLPLFIAGLLILPLTFEALRKGSLAFSACLILVMAGAALLIAGRFGEPRKSVACAAFTVGTLLGEAYFFVSWFLTYQGTQDTSGGLLIAVIEGLGISAVGCIAIFLASGLRRFMGYTTRRYDNNY